VQLAFANVNAPEIGEYGVDHVKPPGLRCRACAFRARGERRRHRWAGAESRGAALRSSLKSSEGDRYAMGAEIDAITEFEEVMDLPRGGRSSRFELEPLLIFVYQIQI